MYQMFSLVFDLDTGCNRLEAVGACLKGRTEPAGKLRARSLRKAARKTRLRHHHQPRLLQDLCKEIYNLAVASHFKF